MAFLFRQMGTFNTAKMQTVFSGLVITRVCRAELVEVNEEALPFLDLDPT